MGAVKEFFWKSEKKWKEMEKRAKDEEKKKLAEEETAKRQKACELEN